MLHCTKAPGIAQEAGNGTTAWSPHSAHAGRYVGILHQKWQEISGVPTVRQKQMQSSQTHSPLLSLHTNSLQSDSELGELTQVKTPTSIK